MFIVGIGTSLPELVSGILAGVSGNSEIVSGNVLGANTSNIFFILGVMTLLSPKGIDLGSQYIMIDLHFMIGSAFLLGLIMMDGEIAFTEGIFLLSAYGVYTYFLLKSGNKANIELDEKHQPIKVTFPLTELLVVVVTSLGIYIGADYTVKSIVDIATLSPRPSFPDFSDGVVDGYHIARIGREHNGHQAGEARDSPRQHHGFVCVQRPGYTGCSVGFR